MCEWFVNNVWHCLFELTSWGDFLAIAFMLNTMFAFEKVRLRLLTSLRKGIDKILEDYKSVIIDNNLMLDKVIDHYPDQKSSCSDMIELKDFVSKLKIPDQEYEEKFEKMSNFFEKMFFIFALITVILIVFSNCQFFKENYRFSVFLLVPCIVYYIASRYYNRQVEQRLKSIREEMKKRADKVNQGPYALMRKMMEDIEKNATR